MGSFPATLGAHSSEYIGRDETDMIMKGRDVNDNIIYTVQMPVPRVTNEIPTSIRFPAFDHDRKYKTIPEKDEFPKKAKRH